jgi:hypothetical protein
MYDVDSVSIVVNPSLPVASNAKHAQSSWGFAQVAVARKLRARVYESTATKSLGLLFDELAEKWVAETSLESSATRICMNMHYQQIIGLGSVALRFILRRVANGEGHWFWALRAITREDPVDPIHMGSTALMSADWLEWGRTRGLT